MTYRSSGRSWALGFALWGALALILPASAQDVHDQIRKSLVFIELKGITDNGVPVGSRGTGFLVSEDGYILTSYHLLEAISKARPESVEIGISVWERKPNPEKRAFVLDAKPNLDLMLLKIPRSQTPYLAVKTGSTRRVSGSAILTSGFRYQESPPDALHLAYSDQITSREGPAGYTFVLGASAEAGQSGSPVYTQDGTVIGVLKGNFGGRTVFVPIEHAATLLLPLTLDPKGDTR